MMVVFGTAVNFSSRASGAIGDVNADGKVDVFDLSILLNHWNTNFSAADLNSDSVVNVFDLSLLLSNWGNTGTPGSPTPSPTVNSTPSTSPSDTPVASAGCGQADIQAMINNVSETSVRAFEQEIVQDDTKTKPNELVDRWIGAPGNQVKTDYIKNTWAAQGLTVAEQPYTADGFAQNNVTGILAGTDTNTFYGVSSHTDADSDTEPTWAQAANDDGSGMAATLEIARVLKPWQHCMKSSVYFGGFNDEEFSMEGSVKFVREIAPKVIKGWYDLDEIAYGTGLPDCVEHRGYATAPASAAIAKKAEDMNTKYAIGQGILSGTTNDPGTDAVSFTDAGLPGVMVDQCAPFDSYRETTNDNLAKINFSQLTKEVKIMVASLAELSAQ